MPLGNGDAPCLFPEGGIRSLLRFTCTLNRGQFFSSSAHSFIQEDGRTYKSGEPFGAWSFVNPALLIASPSDPSGRTFMRTLLGNRYSICLIVLRTAEPRRVFCWMICIFVTIHLQTVTTRLWEYRSIPLAVLSLYTKKSMSNVPKQFYNNRRAILEPGSWRFGLMKI